MAYYSSSINPAPVDPPPYVPAPGDGAVRIVQSSGFGGIRTVLTGRKVVESRSIPSIKARGAFHTDAGLEPRIAMRMEIDTSIVRMMSQPYRVEGVVAGRPFTMINDVAVLHGDGTRDVIEFKGSARRLRDPLYSAKLDIAEEGYAAHGIGMQRLSGDELEDPDLDDRVAHVFIARFTTVLERHRTAAARLLWNSGGRTTIGALGAVLDPNPLNARSIAYAMSVRRFVRIALDAPLGDDSLVDAVPPDAIHLPSLRL